MDRRKRFTGLCMLTGIEIAACMVYPIETGTSMVWLMLRLLYLGVMLSFAGESKCFSIAGVGSVVSPVVGLISMVVFTVAGYSFRLKYMAAFIPFIVIGNIWKYYECKGYSEVATNLKMKTGVYWEKLWLVYMIGNLVLMLGFSDNIGNAEKIVKVVGFAILVIAGLIKSGLLIYTLFKLKKKGRGDYVNV